jgi:hypothetical protein
MFPLQPWPTNEYSPLLSRISTSVYLSVSVCLVFLVDENISCVASSRARDSLFPSAAKPKSNGAWVNKESIFATPE